MLSRYSITIFFNGVDAYVVRFVAKSLRVFPALETSAVFVPEYASVPPQEEQISWPLSQCLAVDTSLDFAFRIFMARCFLISSSVALSHKGSQLPLVYITSSAGFSCRPRCIVPPGDTGIKRIF